MLLGLRNTLYSNGKDHWIEGRRTYVDLGIIPTWTTKLETELILLGNPYSVKYGEDIEYDSNNSNMYLPYGSSDAIVGHMGSSDSNDWRMFTGNVNASTKNGSLYFDAGYNRCQKDDIALGNIWTNVILGTGCKFQFKNANANGTVTNSQSGSINSRTVKLFGDPTNTVSHCSRLCAWAGFRYVKIWQDNVLVRDFVPGRSNGQGCFKCKITGTECFGELEPLAYH